MIIKYTYFIACMVIYEAMIISYKNKHANIIQIIYQ